MTAAYTRYFWRYTSVSIIIDIRTHRICVAYRCGLLLLTCGMVGRSVRHEMYPARTAGPIEMPFGMWVGVGPSNHVLDGGRDPPGEEAILGDLFPIE